MAAVKNNQVKQKLHRPVKLVGLPGFSLGFHCIICAVFIRSFVSIFTWHSVFLLIVAHKLHFNSLFITIIILSSFLFHLFYKISFHIYFPLLYLLFCAVSWRSNLTPPHRNGTRNHSFSLFSFS